MSDLRNMSREFLTEFIELYRAHPCLWYVKSKEYSDRNKKNCAYEKLVEKLREVDATASKDLVIKKINTIRGCFRKEHKKVLESVKSGASEEDVYHPHLWYYDLLLFLQDHEIPRGSTSNILMEDFESNTEIFSDTQEEPSVDTNKEPEQSIPSTSTTFRRKRSKCNDKASKADEILTVIGQKLQTEDDEFDAVGNNVSCKLRRLPHDMKIFAEKLISDVLYYAELGRLSEHTTIIIDPRPCPSGPPVTVVPQRNDTPDSGACCQPQC